MPHFIFLDSKITADSAEGGGSREIKGCLLLERKSMTNLGSVLKSRDFIHFADKGSFSQSYGFSNSHVWV